MPNWCENKLIVKGKSEEIVRFLERHVVDDILDCNTFPVSAALFGKNRFDHEKILDENTEEITFWVSTKWGANPAIQVCDIIAEDYPSLEFELYYFSVESAFCGYYLPDSRGYMELDESNAEELEEKFLLFGVEAGFLEETSDGKYCCVHDTLTPRLLF